MSSLPPIIQHICVILITTALGILLGINLQQIDTASPDAEGVPVLVPVLMSVQGVTSPLAPAGSKKTSANLSE